MSNQEILEKAIKKAIDGGWKQGIPWMDVVVNSWSKFQDTEGLPALIFNHDLARALWGEDLTANDPAEWPDERRPKWEYHLQEMVIAEDPIEYLGEHLDG